MNKSILITGVAGFLGRTLARHFFNLGWTVNGVDMVSPENAPSSVLNAYLTTNLPDPKFDIFLKQVNPDACIHCAGRASVGASIYHPFDDYSQGPALTYYILDKLHQQSPQCKFIFLSSAAVYGNPKNLPVTEDSEPAPISPYGFHKWQSEIICQEFNQIYHQPTACLRIFSAYGPGLHRQVIWDICEKAISRDELCLEGSGLESRDFVHSSDIAQAVELVINTSCQTGEIYNLGSGRQISISYLAKLVLEYLKIENREVNFDHIVPTGKPLNWQADIDKIKKLGFSPAVSFEEGLNSFVSWFNLERGK